MPSVRFAVIADSHFHPPGVPEQAVWESDRHFNARNRAAIALVRRAEPAFAVHLGDVPHPVPGLAAHADALAVAHETYAALEAPLYVVPGNHDVGDKPHPWAPAPSVSPEKHAVFATHWGAPWWVIERDGIVLVGIDTPVLNSGLALEAEQWEWLADTLAKVRGQRIFAFVHYPPFLLEPSEPEHYDNLAEPGRGRLLDLLVGAGVEALFCGHVHHPFWNRYVSPTGGALDIYLLPSTAFVRPGYAELARVGPGAEHGRDDGERLGFCVVHVDDGGHRVEWVRTGGAIEAPEIIAGLGPGEARPRCPVGLTLRHSWDAVLDIPADGLDPFRRKQARNDLTLLATWELGATVLRLPLEDLRRPATRARLLALAANGQRAILWTPEAPTAEDVALVEAHRHAILAVEFIVPRAWLDRALPSLAVPRWVAPLGSAPVSGATAKGRYFSHFTPHGFALGEGLSDDPDLGRATGDGVVVRVDPEVDAWEGIAAAAGLRREGRAVMALVLLPRGGESVTFTDDAAVTRRVALAALAARAHPEITVVLDTFQDHDRGYFTRHGLYDRRGNPRPAARVLASLARLVPEGARPTREGSVVTVPGLGRVWLDGGEGVEGERVDLERGVLATGIRGPVLERE
ncbi:MAG: metallophosphoesterase [Pseudomonadota bacterium]|nr:metallophosphoesterase [Pseudomonadota bacterium]